MKNIITDKFEEKQVQIHLKRNELKGRYPSLWEKMISEWNSEGMDDLVWLTYSANYLFRTANVRWAIDPLSLNWRIPEAPKMDLTHDLQNLSFVLLTHSHKDHLDFDLISALKQFPIRWIIPEYLIPLILQKTQISENQILVPHPLKPIEIEGLRILPFEGQHLVTHPNGLQTGVQEMGYLVEKKDKRWLFPGDTRIFDASRFPTFDKIRYSFCSSLVGARRCISQTASICGSFL